MYSTSEYLTKAEFLSALEKGSFGLLYQPVRTLEDRDVKCIETSLIWLHPELGALPQAFFEPAAREQGVLSEIQKAATAEGIANCAAWTKAGLDWQVAIDLDLDIVAEPDFADGLRATLQLYELTADRLIINIPEESFAVAGDRGAPLIAALTRLGVAVALKSSVQNCADDSEIAQARFDILKISGKRLLQLSALMQGTGEGFLAARLALARTMGAVTQALNIESADTLSAAKALGFDWVCGPVIDPAMSITELDAWHQASIPAAEFDLDTNDGQPDEANADDHLEDEVATPSTISDDQMILVTERKEEADEGIRPDDTATSEAFLIEDSALEIGAATDSNEWQPVEDHSEADDRRIATPDLHEPVTLDWTQITSPGETAQQRPDRVRPKRRWWQRRRA